VNDDPKDDGIPDFLDRKKQLSPAEYEDQLKRAREATERANRSARPPATPKPEKPPTAALKPAPKPSKLPVPPPKERRSVLDAKKIPPVAKSSRTEDVQALKRTAIPAAATSEKPSPAKALVPPTADNRKATVMTTTTTKTKARGVTSPAPKKVDRNLAGIVKRAVKDKAKSAAKARTPVKGKTTKTKTKRAVSTREPRGTTVKILEAASRKLGVSRAELDAITAKASQSGKPWKGTPWKWNFDNPQGTGYCNRFGYKLTILTGKDGETRYQVKKI
jgi:hypothetical protein